MRKDGEVESSRTAGRKKGGEFCQWTFPGTLALVEAVNAVDKDFVETDGRRSYGRKDRKRWDKIAALLRDIPAEKTRMKLWLTDPDKLPLRCQGKFNELRRRYKRILSGFPPKRGFSRELFKALDDYFKINPLERRKEARSKCSDYNSNMAQEIAEGNGDVGLQDGREEYIIIDSSSGSDEPRDRDRVPPFTGYEHIRDGDEINGDDKFCDDYSVQRPQLNTHKESQAYRDGSRLQRPNLVTRKESRRDDSGVQCPEGNTPKESQRYPVYKGDEFPQQRLSKHVESYSEHDFQSAQSSDHKKLNGAGCWRKNQIIHELDHQPAEVSDRVEPNGVPHRPKNHDTDNHEYKPVQISDNMQRDRGTYRGKNHATDEHDYQPAQISDHKQRKGVTYQGKKNCTHVPDYQPLQISDPLPWNGASRRRKNHDTGEHDYPPARSSDTMQLNGASRRRKHQHSDSDSDYEARRKDHRSRIRSLLNKGEQDDQYTAASRRMHLLANADSRSDSDFKVSEKQTEKASAAHTRESSRESEALFERHKLRLRALSGRQQTRPISRFDDVYGDCDFKINNVHEKQDQKTSATNISGNSPQSDAVFKRHKLILNAASGAQQTRQILRPPSDNSDDDRDHKGCSHQKNRDWFLTSEEMDSSILRLQSDITQDILEAGRELRTRILKSQSKHVRSTRQTCKFHSVLLEERVSNVLQKKYDVLRSMIVDKVQGQVQQLETHFTEKLNRASNKLRQFVEDYMDSNSSREADHSRHSFKGDLRKR